jgi:hypothetical protein
MSMVSQREIAARPRGFAWVAVLGAVAGVVLLALYGGAVLLVLGVAAHWQAGDLKNEGPP